MCDSTGDSRWELSVCKCIAHTHQKMLTCIINLEVCECEHM